MTSDQLNTLCFLLNIEGVSAQAAHYALVKNQPLKTCAAQYQIPIAQLEELIQSLQTAELRIRSTFICHMPRQWEVVVGHHDMHRAPGMLTFEVDETVRLVCARVGVMIPVRITHIPDTVGDYYKGVILDVERSSMSYAPGDSALFSEDQIVTSAGVRRPRKPLPI